MQNFCLRHLHSPLCTEFYISKILQNHSATRIVFHIEMLSKYAATNENGPADLKQEGTACIHIEMWVKYKKSKFLSAPAAYWLPP